MTALDVCPFARRKSQKGIVEFFIPRVARSQLEVIGRARTFSRMRPAWHAIALSLRLSRYLEREWQAVARQA
jgi:hypothetical protein